MRGGATAGREIRPWEVRAACPSPCLGRRKHRYSYVRRRVTKILITVSLLFKLCYSYFLLYTLTATAFFLTCTAAVSGISMNVWRLTVDWLFQTRFHFRCEWSRWRCGELAKQTPVNTYGLPRVGLVAFCNFSYFFMLLCSYRLKEVEGMTIISLVFKTDDSGNASHVLQGWLPRSRNAAAMRLVKQR